MRTLDPDALAALAREKSARAVAIYMPTADLAERVSEEDFARGDYMVASMRAGDDAAAAPFYLPAEAPESAGHCVARAALYRTTTVGERIGDAHWIIAPIGIEQEARWAAALVVDSARYDESLVEWWDATVRERLDGTLIAIYRGQAERATRLWGDLSDIDPNPDAHDEAGFDEEIREHLMRIRKALECDEVSIAKSDTFDLAHRDRRGRPHAYHIAWSTVPLERLTTTTFVPNPNGSAEERVLATARTHHDPVVTEAAFRSDATPTDVVISPLLGGEVPIGFLRVSRAVRPPYMFGNLTAELIEATAKATARLLRSRMTALEKQDVAKQAEQARLDAAEAELNQSIMHEINHQIRSPLKVAIDKVIAIKSEPALQGMEHIELLADSAINSVWRVYRISRGTDIYRALHLGAELPQKNKQKLSGLFMYNLVKRAVRDVEKLWSDQAGAPRIRFHGADQDLAGNWGRTEADPDLIDQLLFNLLENAMKYSYPQSLINARIGVSGSGRPFVRVANYGEPFMLPASKLIERGVRDDSVILRISDGAGLGLWIVDQVMKRLNGDLVIVRATSHEARHQFTLMFPK